MARRTLEQQLAASEARTVRLKAALSKTARKLDSRRKIVIAEAGIAEGEGRPGFEQQIKAVVRKRVTTPLDVAVVAEWLATT
jgi:hypothetical protein